MPWVCASYTPDVPFSMGFLPLGHMCLVNRLGILACIPFLNYRKVGGASGIESACQCRRLKRYRFDPWAWEIP